MGSGADLDPTTEELLGTLPGAPRARATVSSEPEASVLESEEPPSGGAAAGASPYALQVGAFDDPDAAGRRAEEARGVAPGLPVEVRRQDGWLKVFVGSFATREEAESALRELSARGLGAAWVTRVVQ